MITEPIFYTNELVYLTGSIFCLYDLKNWFVRIMLFSINWFCFT